MQGIPEINIVQAKERIDQGGVTVVDIRDPHSYATARIPGAQHLSNNTFPDFLANTARDIPVIVCCYHGNSSKGATAYLLQQGFKDVHSLSGGLESWRLQYQTEKG